MEGSVKKDVNIVIDHGQKQQIQSVLKSTPSCDKWTSEPHIQGILPIPPSHFVVWLSFTVLSSGWLLEHIWQIKFSDLSHLCVYLFPLLGAVNRFYLLM